MREFLKELEEGGEARKTTDPVWAARSHMKPQLPKRFYEKAEAAHADGGFTVHLDGRALKTPGKRAIILPDQDIAREMAQEWDAQEGEINPVSMPFTRLVNTALDGVVDNPDAVLEDVVRFSGTDLLCYRIEQPEGLAANQRSLWDPILDWAETRLGSHFEITSGIAHVVQPKATIRAMSEALKAFKEPLALTCVHTFCSLSGSAIIALALAEKAISAETAWKAAHVEEDWNVSRWGEDGEAKERRNERWRNFEAAHRLINALGFVASQDASNTTTEG